MLHEEQRGLFDPRGLPLAPFDDHHRGVEVLLLLAESHLHHVLLLDRRQVLVGGIRWGILQHIQDSRVSIPDPLFKFSITNHYLKAVHDGQVEAYHQGGELSDARPRSLNAVNFPRDRHLVTLLVGIGAVRVGEVDVAIGFRHNAPYRVSALTN